MKARRDTQRRRRSLFAAVALAALLSACGTSEEQVFFDIASPDGNHALRVTVAESRLPRGTFYVSAYLVDRASKAATRLYRGKLENDGVPFTSRNIAGRWTSATTALLCLRASDRPDHGLRVEVGPPPRAEEVEQC